MEQVYRIRNLKIFEGKSLRSIAKQTGHDFETVKKYAEQEDFNLKIKPKRRREGKLSPYEATVRAWLTEDKQNPRKQRHTAKRVFDRLQQEYGETFTVSDRAVRNLVANIRKEMDLNTAGFLPLEHPPGEAQADFGEARFIENGISYDGYYLNLSYPYSNGGHAQLFKGLNQECLLEGLKSIFLHIGGVPTAIWFDNLSTVVKKIKAQGQRDLTDGFLRFMMHYRFDSNFCNPHSGHEKGSVENKVGYHRRNLFVPIPECNDLAEYNRQLLSRCDRDMNRPHYRGRGEINRLFVEDQEAFSELPRIAFDVYRQQFAKADQYGKVKLGGKTYSASPRVAGQEVLLKIGANQVEILDLDCHNIVTHKRLYGDCTESMNWIPYLELLSKRPTALKYTGLYNGLPPTLKAHLDQCGYDQKKQILKLFAKIVLVSGMETALETLKSGVQLGATDTDSLWALFCKLHTEEVPAAELKLPDSVPKLNNDMPDLSVYDRLFVSEGGLS